MLQYTVLLVKGVSDFVRNFFRRSAVYLTKAVNKQSKRTSVSGLEDERDLCCSLLAQKSLWGERE
ncbi:hypothetical protein EYZ11_011115 [Aspergillus tanneri]|uniref:Uncharacterized protein n=1 Tax=Aspergillus tanneri TaxID=1220188 RepID=A0A4S3J494_9EURO|nr:hypothetical protein EYZ11_011115 [Aspergillus tanneri]